MIQSPAENVLSLQIFLMAISIPLMLLAALVEEQAALIAWLLYERQQRHRSEASAHELSGRLINAQEDERARLARELHDDVTQRLALLAIDAGREERNLPGAPAAAMRTDARRPRPVERGRACAVISASSLDPGRPRLDRRAEVRMRALHADVLRSDWMCNAQDIPETLPHDVALCLFRIAQEALRNIARHSGASRAEVSLRRLDGGLQLAVKDDGAGFDPAQHRAGSLGHASMRQRAILLGGKLDIDSSPGRGTTILAWVPLKEEERSEPSARAAG